ncbi:MAG: PBP1A family penicillin-binding protein, partial [Anaerolineales bacterium]|nr:PBP1A family penicillin-binding protein [Anaerolineales bacterium]
KTISLLDLMNETEADDGRLVISEADVRAASPDEEETGPLVIPDEPLHPPSTPDVLPPLYADDLIPPDRPPVRDEGATVVQPRIAFPGSTRFDENEPPEEPSTSERTTAWYDRPQRPGQRPDQGATPPSERVTQIPQDTPPAATPRRDQPIRQQPTSRRQVEQTPPARQEPTRRRPIEPAARGPEPARDRPVRQQPVRQPEPPRRQEPVGQPDGVVRSRPRRNVGGCVKRIISTSLILGFLGTVLGLIALVIGYISIASQLPKPTELQAKASTFETARIYDRDGNELYALIDPNAGDRTVVPLSRISQDLIDATIATEDSRFYTNPGFDPIGIARAIIGAARAGEFGAAGGASTITQQLARALLLDEEERTQVTFSRKVREIILAAEIYRTYDKEVILELYLNEIYYGNRAYGIEAASQTYFNKSAADLTLAEASLLAGLPQAPAVWDPITNPEFALGRQSEVLGLMVSEGYVTQAEAEAALAESAPVVRELEPPNVQIDYPHFVFTVLRQLETAGDAQAIYRGGLRIYTTLDPRAQELAEQTLTNQRGNINAAGANNAALVAIEPGSGEILALVGSVDFNDEVISGQVNMALQPRQPGSTIKPLVYLAAMEQGWTAATLIWDVPTTFPDGNGGSYQPKNYDDRFHGPLLLRQALGNSYNITAVKALEYVGVCNFVSRAQGLGLTSLVDSGCQEVGAPRDLGLSLALGGGAVTPLEMASAFSAFANQGRRMPPIAIRRIEDRNGNILFEATTPADDEIRAMSAEDAYIITNILSDNNARQPSFGINNLLRLNDDRPVAVKTGTSGSSANDVRDGWTIGYTPQVVTAVWVGNTDPAPVNPGQSGYGMASPIWNAYMNSYLADKPV